MRDSINQYYADKNAYPPTLEALVTEKILTSDTGGSVHELQYDVAGHDVGDRSGQPGGAAGRIRCEEWI